MWILTTTFFPLSKLVYMINVFLLLPDQLKKPMGGMGEQARNFLTHFPPGYHFSVIGSSEAEVYHTDNYSFYPVISISNFHGNPDPLCTTFLNQSLFIEKALSLNQKPDIIHAFDWSTFWAGRILANHYNCPLVVTIQLSIEKINSIPVVISQKNQYDLACSLELSGLIEADAIIQVSESYAKSFHSFLLPKTAVIHNGINLNEWNKNSTIALPGINPIKVFYIGRYAIMKNIHTLIQCTIPKSIDLIFIGDSRGGNPELFDAMVQFCNSTPNVHFVGPKYGQEKIDWLCAADAVIVPSIHEPFGIVALEALASKSILLSSFVNGMGDFLSEDCAINCGTTKESIELAFEKLLQLKPNEKESIIKSGLKVCEEHSWNLQAEKMSKVYDSVLSN